ncbi:MAG: hypothetical protein WEA75_03870, partial [Acidimicrobiia bacterium]
TTRMRDVPPSRSDRQLLLITGSFLVIAAVFFGGVLWVATLRKSSDNGPQYIGRERSLERKILKASPYYFANPSGGDGYWLDVEDGELVALVLDRPGTKDCVVKWKAQRDAYVDCNDQELSSENLDRYKVTIGPRDGSPKGSVYVDFRKISPAPNRGLSPS